MNTVLLILLIILVIPSTIGLLYRMHLDEAQVRARLAREARQRKQQTVLERRTETVTEKVIIELVPNDELSQSLTNLIGSIDNNTDATNHHATVIETTAHVFPLLQESQERAIQPVDLGQDGSQASSKVDTKTRQEIIADLFLEDPTIGGKEIERRTGIPDATARRILKELKST